MSRGAVRPEPMRSSFTIEGELVRREGGDDTDTVSLLMSPYLLEFRLEDVLDVEELAPAPGLRTDRAASARVTLRAEARLLDVSAGKRAEALVFEKITPFSVCSREGAGCEIRQERFQRMEAAPK